MQLKILINFFRLLLALLVIVEYTLYFNAIDFFWFPVINQLKLIFVFIFGMLLIFVCNRIRDFIVNNSTDTSTTFVFFMKIFGYIITIQSAVSIASSRWGWWILSVCLGIIAACFDEMITEEDFAYE